MHQEICILRYTIQIISPTPFWERTSSQKEKGQNWFKNIFFTNFHVYICFDQKSMLSLRG